MASPYFNLATQTLLLGQPLELIDGDNLIFLEDIRKTFSLINHNNEDLLVVSAIGPQSGGKSLLLNFLFGAQFFSSAGKCTKGIYCSLMRFKDEKTGRIRNLLILDSEGIQSAEARDNTFDKRIVYFIICVSHVVLICNKQEMNSEMSNVVKLVGDAVKNTKHEFISNPSVYIIINMVTQVNDA